MKKFYVSPAVEVTAFTAEDILCASTITFDGQKEYDLVSNGIAVDTNGVQRIEGTADAPYNFGQ